VSGHGYFPSSRFRAAKLEVAGHWERADAIFVRWVETVSQGQELVIRTKRSMGDEEVTSC
jgi:hypothetical protein